MAKASVLQGGSNLTLGWSGPSRVHTGLLLLLPHVSWRLGSCSHKQTWLTISLGIRGWLACRSCSSPNPVHVLGPGRVLSPLSAVHRDGLRDSKRNQAEKQENSFSRIQTTHIKDTVAPSLVGQGTGWSRLLGWQGGDVIKQAWLKLVQGISQMGDIQGMQDLLICAVK